MKITDTDVGNDNINYINNNTSKIIINEHNNDKNGPKIIDLKSKTLMRQLRRGFNKYLIRNSTHEHYNDTSAFTKLFRRNFNKYTPHDLRKCISSQAIHEGDPVKIKILERNQGHILMNKYNIGDINFKTKKACLEFTRTKITNLGCCTIDKENVDFDFSIIF